MSVAKNRPPNPQQQQYETIHDAYEVHYYDASSMAYRHRFIYGPLVAGLDLTDASLADLACGSGHNSLAMRSYFPTITTTGYDISPSACRDYETRTGGNAHQIDLTVPYKAEQTHDAALVIGGLHHCVADLDATFRNVAQMVRPGGYFLMMEPNDDFILSVIRRVWYRRDRWFEADTEEALKHDEIASRAAPYFTPVRVEYFGGPAFYLILNSLIMRIPLKAKPFLRPFLFPLERIYNLLPGRKPYAAFLAVWRRNEVDV
ncbi:class I SAM-dependent methyltransferase [Marivibrio halodurans]|uniref:Class I SAM-dependent methyltransferase n=1 Tax=Marivibrio halodurans TaxID=2039722 RepID=A0A8J7S4S4_9PROT|nr:class I SAM-dependent methyltransferase [Marivibrio halodurans]MBP5855622.1 class I SAM-dependent methyltransferase [Marivibrio halodurans]